MNFSSLDLKTTFKDDFLSERRSPSIISNDGNKTTESNSQRETIGGLCKTRFTINYFTNNSSKKIW